MQNEPQLLMDCLKAPAVQDGILNDDELNLFQTKCFAAPLQSHELSGIKTVVADKMPEVRPGHILDWICDVTCSSPMAMPPTPSASRWLEAQQC